MYEVKIHEKVLETVNKIYSKAVMLDYLKMIDRLSFLPNKIPQMESPSGELLSIAYVNPFVFLYSVDEKNKVVYVVTGFYMGEDYQKHYKKI